MISSREKKSLGSSKPIRFNSSKTSTAAVEEKETKQPVQEKPHKSSLGKAKKKAKRLREEIPSEEALLEQLPQLAPDSQEKIHLDEYLHMFRRLQRLVRKAEKTCLAENSNSREYYALCALYSQQREVIADIRSVSDMSGQVATLESSVIRPAISSIGQNVLDSMFQIKKVIMECSSPDKTQAALLAIEQITSEQGKFLQHQYGLAVDKVSSILLG